MCVAHLLTELLHYSLLLITYLSAAKPQKQGVFGGENLMDYIFKPGDIVLSDAGRDSGRYFVVLKTEENFAFVADGDLRKTDTPKRKKFKHLKFTGEKSGFALSKIADGEKLTNNEVRRIIQEFGENI